jgi:hypothetical protein
MYIIITVFYFNLQIEFPDHSTSKKQEQGRESDRTLHRKPYRKSRRKPGG